MSLSGKPMAFDSIFLSLSTPSLDETRSNPSSPTTAIKQQHQQQQQQPLKGKYKSKPKHLHFAGHFIEPSFLLIFDLVFTLLLSLFPKIKMKMFFVFVVLSSFVVASSDSDQFLRIKCQRKTIFPKSPVCKAFLSRLSSSTVSSLSPSNFTLSPSNFTLSPSNFPLSPSNSTLSPSNSSFSPTSLILSSTLSLPSARSASLASWAKALISTSSSLLTIYFALVSFLRWRRNWTARRAFLLGLSKNGRSAQATVSFSSSSVPSAQRETI